MEPGYAILLVIIFITTGQCSRYSKPNSGLTSIPSDIPSDTTEVNLKLNNIAAIPTNSFLYLSECTVMYLSNNYIATIEDGAFNGMDKLEDLHLGSNKLREIRKEMWRGLTSLKYLRLNSNDITTIHPDAFSLLPNLETLTLNSNSLTWVSPEMFSGLNSIKSLYIENNDIRTVEPKTFYDLPLSLKSLKLGYNQIPTFPPDMLNWMDKDSLLMLSIDNNPIECDTNVCWLVKARKTNTNIQGYEMEELLPNCEYVTNYENKCPQGDPDGGSTGPSGSTGKVVQSGSLMIILFTAVMNVI